MRKTFLIALLLATGMAQASPAVPSDLNGRKIQFSYPTSWKFTPLLIQFGQAETGKPNTYVVHGEGRCCEVTYTPDTTAGKAQLSVSGKRDKASISMSFITKSCGTARMKWNGADYYQLHFRLEEDNSGRDYLSRMGDPVGDVMPASMAGRVLELDFAGAFGGTFNPETQNVDYHEWSSAPWLVRFPLSNERTTVELPGEESAVSATYEPMGCGAMISLKGEGISGEITLDFASSDSGLARVEWEKRDTCRVVCAVKFNIRDTASAGSAPVSTADKQSISQPQAQNEDDGPSELLRELEKRTYKTAVERLYQKRLLTLLAQMAQGASVDTVLPDANGTTALHNACGLSHAEIVQWLVDHGANTNAKTAKGASVDACIGGPNAKAIRTILRNARTSK